MFLRWVLIFLLWGGAAAAEGLGDVQRIVFVAGKNETAVAAIAIDTDKIVGRLDLGLVPHRMQVSESLAKLVAADGRAGGVAVAELAAGKVQFLPLAFSPDRLLVSPDGLTLMAANDNSGAIALIDLLTVKEKGRIAGPANIRDVMFTGDATSLFIAADSVRGVAIYDVAAARQVSVIEGAPAIALARSPNGREGFALSDGTILHFDLKTRTILGNAPGQGAAALFPTGTGRYLMLPGSTARTLTIAPTQPLASTRPLKAAAGVSAAYSAWFDTVAFVLSGPARTVLVYDLERLEPAGALALSGTPGPGVVTPDGGKLYLPVEESGEVVAIDARFRRRAASIPVGFSPVLAVMAGGYGICH